jgi:mannitol-1-phosphate 5-dehydrogenase
MKMVDSNKMVMLGAGKIGRSFIGQLFSRGGFEVVFVDMFRPLIDELNRRRKYKIIIKSEKEEILWIENVRGVYAGNEEEVVQEIGTAGIVAVSVGQAGLPDLVPLIARGLLYRHTIDYQAPLDIIIAENLRNAADYFSESLGNLLPEDYSLKEMVGLVETSIGKMVPIMLKKDVEEDILQIFAEPYNTLILDKKAFKNPIPAIEGLAPKENMKAWVDRKLYIHNLGHASAAYLGYIQHPKWVYLYEALADKEIFKSVRETMLQASIILLAEYPGEFTLADLTKHIDDLLLRFQNQALGDTIFRVGCDLMRKLAAEDRLSGAIRLAIKHKLPYNRILNALVSGFHFRAGDENGMMFPDDQTFVTYYTKGIETILSRVCRFEEDQISIILNEAIEIDRMIRSGRHR